MEKETIREYVDQFDRNGYLILRNVLSPDKVRHLQDAVDEIIAGEPESLSYSVRNTVALHPAIFSLIDEPTVLPIIVNALNINIQMQISHLLVRHPNPDQTDEDRVNSSINWHQDGPHPQFPALGGITPRYYIKACYILSDLSEPDRGNTKIIPGSHRIPNFQPNHRDPRKPLEEELQLCGLPGDVFLFPNNMWHSAAPNQSDITRKQLFIGYNYLWMKPIDYGHVSDDLLAKANPVQKQLLGVVDGAQPFNNYVPAQKKLPLYPYYLEETSKGVYS